MIPGAGPRPHWIAFLGEAPGGDEIKSGLPFTGPSGEILWQMTWREIGLSRDEVYVTNVIKERLTEEEEEDGVDPVRLKYWHDELRAELAHVRPRIIVALGKYAMQFLMGTGLKMDTTHGMAYDVPMAWGMVRVAVAFHPAAGIHDSTRLAFTWQDLVETRKIIDGEKVPVPMMRSPGLVTELRDEEWFELTGDLSGDWAFDTEYDPTTGEVWELSFSYEPGRAYVVHRTQRQTLAVIAGLLAHYRPVIWLHNALADIRPLKALGIDLVAMGLDIRDSMIYAFHLGTEPQGLKALMFRGHGYRMRDYEDVVHPYYEAALDKYLTTAREVLTPPMITPIGKRGQPLKPRRAPQSQEYGVVNGALRDKAAKPEKVSLIKRWEGWEEGKRDVIAAFVGEAGPRGGLHLVPRDEDVQYAGEDALATRVVGPALAERMDPDQADVVRMDHERLPMLDRMAEVGLKVDRGRVASLLADIEEGLEDTLELIRAVVGDDTFNPNSADQVAEFSRLEYIATGAFHLDKLTRSKKRVSTDRRALAGVTDHVLPPLILKYRALTKLRSTYLLPMLGFLDPLDILHVRWRHTRVVTGRLAAADPNLLAFPTRGKLGKRVRACIVARHGHYMGSWDHSQIEWRVAADEAQDETMIAEILAGQDAHTEMSKRIFGSPDFRTVSKVLNYGQLYLATAMTLYAEANAAGISQFDLDDWAWFQGEWHRTYRRIQPAVDRAAAQARRLGYVTDRWGRRRKLPGAALQGWRWPFSSLREEAIRQAWSMQIQGGAQGYMERAQILVDQEVLPTMRDLGYWVEPLLQIHDELVLEYDKEAQDTLNSLMLAVMTADSDKMAVPILASSSHGEDWGELK